MAVGDVKFDGLGIKDRRVDILATSLVGRKWVAASTEPPSTVYDISRI
jgi:hypothetical protein